MVPHLELQPLDLTKIGEFLHNRSTLTRDRRRMRSNISKVAIWFSLYNTPLMLTLLEQVLTPAGDFPDGRADLFSAYLCRLIAREGEKHGSLFDRLFSEDELTDFRDAARPSNGDADQTAFRLKLICQPNHLFDALSDQAYQRQRAVIREERQEVSFERIELRSALREAFGVTKGDLILKAAEALNLLVATEDRKVLRFRHQQFQEFFAARQLRKSG